MIEPSASALWARLRQAGLVAGDAPAEAVTVTPWYIRTMLGIAGCFLKLFHAGNDHALDVRHDPGGLVDHPYLRLQHRLTGFQFADTA